MTNHDYTLELLGENPKFELILPVGEQIDLELIPCGTAGGRKSADWHRLIVSAAGQYCFRLSSRQGEVTFELHSPDGGSLARTTASPKNDGSIDGIELAPGEYALSITSPAPEPVGYTLKLSGRIA